ncbi:MAG: glycosyltransferase [Candidatus Tantalella remota]|nr:glycosyltransferase [Candidatus Tantalella remota]
MTFSASSKNNRTDDLVSVIIPVLNDSERLRGCLEALHVQTYFRDSIEIIVVDNGSTEDIREVTDRFSNTIYVREEMPGPAAARNKGIESSKGEILAFTDSDCIPSAHWIEKGVQVLSGTPGCGLVAGKIKLFGQEDGEKNIMEEYDSITYMRQDVYVKKYGFGATANLFTSRAVMEKVGMFLSDVFKQASGEDTEWGRRVLRAGYVQVYCENAVVMHPAESSLGALINKTKRLAAGNHMVNKLEKDKTFGQISRDNLESTGRVFFQIWNSSEVSGFFRKVSLSILAIVILFVKVCAKIGLTSRELAK